MSKKLYRVTCEVEVFFVADDGAKVSDIEIEDFAREEIRNNGLSVGVVKPVADINAVPTVWRDTCPYSEATENFMLTVAEFLGGKNQ
jgi:hypothetical protein